MRRERKLMILTGVLVVCAAGAFGISRIDFEEKMTGTETTIVDADSADIRTGCEDVRGSGSAGRDRGKSF